MTFPGGHTEDHHGVNGKRWAYIFCPLDFIAFNSFPLYRERKSKANPKQTPCLTKGSSSPGRVPQHLLTASLGAPRCGRPRLCCCSQHAVSVPTHSHGVLPAPLIPHSLIGRELLCCSFLLLQALALSSSQGLGDRMGVHCREGSSPCTGTCSVRKPSSLDTNFRLRSLRSFLRTDCIHAALAVCLSTSPCHHQERRRDRI